MAIRLRHIAALAFVPFTLSMGAANAADPEFTSVCAGPFYELDTVIVAATFLGGNAASNEAGLRLKLDGADLKLVQKKYTEAGDLLIAIGDKVDELAGAPKPKLSGEDALLIHNSIVPAMKCVSDAAAS